MFNDEVPTGVNEESTTSSDAEITFIREQQAQNPDLIVEPILAPNEGATLRSATFQQITQRLLPTIPGFEGISTQQISAMSPDQLVSAVSKINEIYAFRGVVVSLGNSDIEYTALPDLFSGEGPSIHTIKSLPTTLQQGDTIRQGNSTWVSGYAFDHGIYEPNRYISREIDDFDLYMTQLASHDPSFAGKNGGVAPAVLAYKRSSLQHVHKYEYQFTPAETGGNPKREALVAAFPIPRVTRNSARLVK